MALLCHNVARGIIAGHHSSFSTSNYRFASEFPSISGISSKHGFASKFPSVCRISNSSKNFVVCHSTMTTTTKTFMAPQHCPSKPPPTLEGDYNSQMLFKSGSQSVKDVDKDTFWPTVEAAGDKLLVVDLYSKWCGPCRMIYPKLVKLSDQYVDVMFLKVDCSSDNKYLFSKMGVGILPTFKIFKNSKLVSEVRGAKYDELVRHIEKAREVCYETCEVVR